MAIFRNIELTTQRIRLSPAFSNAFVDGSTFGQVACEVESLADSACVFFRGTYPLQSPHFCWGDLIDLPWSSEYWFPVAGGALAPKSIEAEVFSISSKFRAYAKDRPLTGKGTDWAEICDLVSDEENQKEYVQGLAVAALLFLDDCLEELNSADQLRAAISLSKALHCIIDMTVKSHLILGIASENARLAAKARHKENYAIKADVFKWCDENLASFDGSLDEAAWSIAEKLVPAKFRTVRQWLTEWKKVRAARTA